VRRGGFWTKHMGLILGAIGNTFGEQLGNMVGTHEQFMKKKTSPPSPLPPKPKLKS